MNSKLSINTTIKLNNGKHIPMLGLGTYQVPDGKLTEDSVKWALEAGYRHIDTAKLYKNEHSVGKAVRESGIPRDKIWITTKLWPIDFLHPRKALEASLERLGMDYVDLYLIHWPVPGTSNKLWKSMEAFANEGLSKTIGVSNFGIDLLEDVLSHANIPPAVNQVRCSPFSYPKELIKFCENNKVAFEAYSPLTQGRELDNGLLNDLAKKHNRSTAQILLRWALQKNLIVIPRSHNQERIVQNSKIYDFSLTDNDMALLDSLAN